MVLFPGGSPGFAEVPWGPLLESTEDCSAGPNSLGDANPEIRLRWGRVGVHGPRSDDGAGGSKHPWSTMFVSRPLYWRDYPLGPGVAVVSTRGGQPGPRCPLSLRSTRVSRKGLLVRWAGARPVMSASGAAKKLWWQARLSMVRLVRQYVVPAAGTAGGRDRLAEEQILRKLSAMVGRSPRCSSRRRVELSTLVGLDVSASSRPHLKATPRAR